MKTEKQNKLNAQINEVLSQRLFELVMEIQSDFGLITVNSSILSADLSYIDVYVSCFKNQDTLCKTLANYAQELKEELKRKIVLRKMPIIRFRYDDSMETENKLISQINNLHIPS